MASTIMRHLLFGAGGATNDKATPTAAAAAAVPAAREEAAPAYQTEILVYVNGTRHAIADPDPSMLLSTFLRETLHLTGTKVACGEGGCGACTVLLGRMDAGGSWSSLVSFSFSFSSRFPSFG